MNSYQVQTALRNVPEPERDGIIQGLNSLNSYNSYSTQTHKPTLEAEALHGLAGEIVQAIAPYTESDPVATLTNILTAFGNVVGRIPYFRVEHTEHHLNLFIAQVGQTSKGRKGTGWSTPKRMVRDVDREWAEHHITGGLSSGEGLIFAVRDERRETKPIREHGRVTDYEQVLVDKGIEDKRLLLIEEELSQALKLMAREGNILSAILRQAWDGGNLNPLTKSNPIKATGAHISIIGHITKDELLRHLTGIEQTNGFANRFCWFLVARSKCISNPVGIPEENLLTLTDRLNESVNFARNVGEIRRDSESETVWASVYPELSEGKTGLMGGIISRAESQVMRLSCLYSLLDKSELIRLQHLKAALALWDYSEKSAKAIFGELTGDPALDKAREALKAAGTLSVTELHELFGKNAPKSEIDRVVTTLLNQGIATFETVEPTGDGKKPTRVLHWATNLTNLRN